RTREQSDSWKNDERELPFVGRHPELDSLRSAWHRAARGMGRTVFISGEAGACKSRLLNELALSVDSEGGRVIVGSTSNSEAQPYQCFVDALQRFAQPMVDADVGFVWLSALSEVLPELDSIVPDLPRAPHLPADEARSRLYQAFTAGFEALARQRPTLLIL